ncbi:MAG: helix-turn-helix domain-containing protein [Blastocatellia bacterium]|nr:helix-turn-helix domain-containing protein [Blastocatellia bacterium]
MSSSLGEKLRQAREERGISISEVAEQTRISSLYLKSIEDDNYKPLPGGIFNKGFIKSYAKYVGIDENEALQDYARLVAETESTQDDPHPKYRPEVLTDDRSASSMLPTIIVAGIILALMTVGILFAVSYIQNQPDTPTVATNSSTSNTESNGGTDNPGPSGPAAVPNEIRLEFKALKEKVSVTSTVDGSLAYDEITPDTPKTYTAQQGVKLRYYRGFADKVQILLNGKQIAPPPPPPKGNIEFEVNKENVARILETGQIAFPDSALATPVATTPATSPPANPQSSVASASPPAQTETSTPRPTATAVRPAFTPLPTPRRSPTPIIVGRPTAPRPSPN